MLEPLLIATVLGGEAKMGLPPLLDSALR
jgi:hypothetical protein